MAAILLSMMILTSIQTFMEMALLADINITKWVLCMMVLVVMEQTHIKDRKLIMYCRIF